MSKVIRAVNAMISNSDRISSVIRGDENPNELFFVYDGKHKWSLINHKDNEYSLYYYPGSTSIETLANVPGDAWYAGYEEMVSYTTKELGTKEAVESMNELYMILSEKLYGMDKILDEIIGTDDVLS